MQIAHEKTRVQPQIEEYFCVAKSVRIYYLIGKVDVLLLICLPCKSHSQSDLFSTSSSLYSKDWRADNVIHVLYTYISVYSVSVWSCSVCKVFSINNYTSIETSENIRSYLYRKASGYDHQLLYWRWFCLTEDKPGVNTVLLLYRSHIAHISAAATRLIIQLIQDNANNINVVSGLSLIIRKVKRGSGTDCRTTSHHLNHLPLHSLVIFTTHTQRLNNRNRGKVASVCMVWMETTL